MEILKRCDYEYDITLKKGPETIVNILKNYCPVHHYDPENILNSLPQGSYISNNNKGGTEPNQYIKRTNGYHDAFSKLVIFFTYITSKRRFSFTFTKIRLGFAD